MKDELTQKQKAFIDEFMKTGNATRSYIAAGYRYPTEQAAGTYAHGLMKKPQVAAEISRRQDEMRSESIATSKQVMEYFTQVMRGEILDQFGLEAPLSERTRAAQELAKRTIDLDNKLAGKADAEIKITLDWAREE